MGKIELINTKAIIHAVGLIFVVLLKAFKENV